MSWVKIDDQFTDNPKIAVLSDAAFRAYVSSICYASRNLTDGVVPLRKAKEFAGRSRVVQELIPGLWEPDNTGANVSVHDYLIYNPTRDKVLAERAAAKARMDAIRSGDVRANNGRTNEGSSLSPVSPSPIPIPDDPDPPEDPVPLRSPEPTTGDLEWGAVRVEFEGLFGLLGGSEVAEAREYSAIVPADWFIAAIKETREKADRPSWRYMKTILDRCLTEHRPPGPKARPSRNLAPEGSAKAQVLARFGR